MSFLELPAEIRNIVYEDVVDGLPEGYLSYRTRSILSSRSALPRVSRQVREEFQAVLYLRASRIIAEVKNFDFRHIVTFLNRLSDKEAATLLAPSATTRHMTIRLEFSKKPPFDIMAGIPLLNRWVNRMDHPTKRGTNIGTTYELVNLPPDLEDVMESLHANLNQDNSDDSELELQKVIEELGNGHEIFK